MFSGKKLLIFGGGFLQLSTIERCKKLSITSIVIDPNPEAVAKDNCDHFEVIGGQDFQATCSVVEKYNIDGIITSATDKPLVMMARVAEHFDLPFYSVNTAQNCTDKSLMKSVFIESAIPCARGYLIKEVTDIQSFPAIIKPLDNSGSRGVFYCENESEAEELVHEAFKHTKSDNILVEDYISGREFSIESLHFNKISKVLQVTEKTTTPFPTNVETGQIAPGQIEDEKFKEIESLIAKIAEAFKFDNCAAHTEIKIDKGTITVIETSPRLGGDFITSDLVPNATSINIEDALIAIALGTTPELDRGDTAHSGAFFLTLPKGNQIKTLPDLNRYNNDGSIKKMAFLVSEGDKIGAVSSSLDRHGYFILKTDSRESLLEKRDRIFEEVYSNIVYH